MFFGLVLTLSLLTVNNFTIGGILFYNNSVFYRNFNFQLRGAFGLPGEPNTKGIAGQLHWSSNGYAKMISHHTLH